MTQIQGLRGFKPFFDKIESLTTPPYDVIKGGSGLEKNLKHNQDSLFHIILGEDPKEILDKFIKNKVLQKEAEPCYFVYEQIWGDQRRLGCLVAVAVSDYQEKEIIRHEKTFDNKVKGRIALAEKIKLTTEPIFLLTQSGIQTILDSIVKKDIPTYQFTSNFQGHTDLDGIQNKIYRVTEESDDGVKIQTEIAKNPLYIADGHHRYHAALLNKQTHTLAYIVQDAKILAYNRLIKGKVSFSSIKESLDLQPCDKFATPPKNTFCIYTKQGSFLMKARKMSNDNIVKSLDASLLERQLYSNLKITHDLILNQNHFDYYSEDELDVMQEQVDLGKYDIAVALHPVSIEELIAVANAGLSDSNVVMPEKSTYFSPKILSGIFLYEFQKKSF